VPYVLVKQEVPKGGWNRLDNYSGVKFNIRAFINNNYILLFAMKLINQNTIIYPSKLILVTLLVNFVALLEMIMKTITAWKLL
jgi:hypothetical protein